jgi:homogentisate phytyltransferase/homogentisate geranylgeranyltransferase
MPHLYVRMLRYRVAAMVWMFMLLGAAFHDGLRTAGLKPLWAAVALASSYVAATTLNDVADRDLDRVNHPGDAGRPLVAGTAQPRDLYALHVFAALLALTAAVLLGALAAAIVGVSLVIGHVYSVPPLRLSYRTWLAPAVLGVAYVLVPYALGLVIAGAHPGEKDAVFAAALYSMFVARITLKDFRDRHGDALYGRPTLLLRFGKRATCRVSFAALSVGAALLLVVLPSALLRFVAAAFLLAIAGQLVVLARASSGRDEQVAIGLGAKLGNGLLLVVLAWLVLAAEEAPAGDRLFFTVVLATAYAASFVMLVRSPERAVIGYKG